MGSLKEWFTGEDVKRVERGGEPQTPEDSRSSATVALVTISAVVVIALGGLVFVLTRPSEEEQVRSTVERFYDAAGTGDIEEACSIFVPTGDQAECLRYADLASWSPEEMRATETGKVTISGDKAFVTLEEGGEVRLRKINGDWRVTYDPNGFDQV